MSTQKYQQVCRRFAIVFTAFALALAISPAALADTDENTPRLTRQPDQLILQLGARWAGVQFQLRTDAGVFPVPVTVDESGVLTMDLGGSTTYTLSCLDSTVPIPDPAPGTEPDPDMEQPSPEVTAMPQQPHPAPGQNKDIPIMPIVVFPVGLAFAAGCGAASFLAKRRWQAVYDDWEDGEDAV